MKLKWPEDRKLRGVCGKSIRDWDTAEGEDNIGWQVKDFVTTEVANKMKEENIECDVFEFLICSSFGGNETIELSFIVSSERRGLLLIQLPYMVKDKLDMAANEIREKLKLLEEEK